MNRITITELIIGAIVVVACILLMVVTGADDAETERAFIHYRASVAADAAEGR